jgi:hypothetical protein
MFEKSER